MQKAILFVLILVLSVAVVVPAMAQDLEPWVCPEGFEGQTLSVFNWSTYLAEDTIPNFEAACGVTVEYSIFENNEAMLSRVSQGNQGFDIVVPTDYMVAIMISEGLLLELDHSKIPNIANVAPRFIDVAFDPGNAHSLPYQWGTLAVGYRTEAFPDGITSWNDVFSNDGKVSWLEDPRNMLAVALVMIGYDPNTNNPDEIQEAAQYLIENSGNVVAIAQDDGQELLAQGEVDAAIEYHGDIYQVIFDCECEDFGYALPSEGSALWTDNMAILKDAPNPDLAHAFMDYILHPQVGADISNATSFSTPNAAAVELGLIDEVLLNDPNVYPSAEQMAKLFTIAERPDVEQDYNDAWEEVKILIGG